MTRLDLRSERGFTLIELTVATLIGTIVSAATLAIVIVSVHLSSNYGDRVDATQQGRIAMAKITQALNSSCVSAKLPPVLPNTVDPANTISAISDGNDVWFYSSLTDTATVTPNLVEISFTGGSLVETTYAWVSGSAPDWVFSTSPSTFTLLPNAALAAGHSTVFQYLGYTGGSLATNLDPTGAAITASTAAQVTEVTINFQANPTDNWTALGRPASVSDSVVLRLAPASSSATNTPCT
jgi:prepilin-type N-terminal cleavage/methylation domain-containing protein